MMKTEYIVILVVTVEVLVESAAWSFSNIMMSGSNANHIFAESIAIGAQRGMEECKYQFQWERWDCPKSSFNLFSKSTAHPATREMAFLHAIVSAAIVITLTRNCSLGHFNICGCDDSKIGAVGLEGWRWAGCSDNVMIGNKWAKQFLDSKELGRDAKALVNLHNNKVGRTIVKKTMRRSCKCHGVSGSCTTQTCWMRMEELRQVGNYLKEAYKKAERVEYNDHGSLLPTKQRKMRNRNSITSTPTLRVPRHRLIYIESSPDYCEANLTAGIKGTKGRQCSRRKGNDVSLSEKQSCRTLCRECGYRVRKKTKKVSVNCECKFNWCCNVKCRICHTKVNRHVCY